MIDESHPWNYNWNRRFPENEMVFLFEGSALFSAEKDGKYYLISDNGTMADFLDENDPSERKILDTMISITGFDTLEEREAYLEEHYGNLPVWRRLDIEIDASQTYDEWYADWEKRFQAAEKKKSEGKGNIRELHDLDKEAKMIGRAYRKAGKIS
ncbi:MAG: hypothetical protein ACPG7F_09680 [Aggregatilineales bacterium]